MSIYRNIVAVMASIVIASPLCCCNVRAAAQEDVPEVSCCSQDAKTNQSCPGGQSCPDCRAGDPLLAEVGKAVSLKVDLPELAPLSLFAVVPVLSREMIAPLPASDFPDPGPPGWRLVLHQAFLI